MKFSTKLSAATRRVLAVTAAACLSNSAFTSMAQSADGLGEMFINSTADTFQSIAGITVRLIRIILGLSALVLLVYAVLKILKGDREAMDKIVYWIVGLIVGFLFLSLVQRYVIDAA